MAKPEIRTVNEITIDISLGRVPIRTVVVPVPKIIYPRGVLHLVGEPFQTWEKAAIVYTLLLCDGHREKAAAILNISERTIYRKIKTYRIKPKALSVQAYTARKIRDKKEPGGLSGRVTRILME